MSHHPDASFIENQSRKNKRHVNLAAVIPCALLALLCSAFSCKDSPPEPLPPAGSDTTSHDIAWQIDTLGTHSSVLLDVAIINDTLAYAVGEIFHRDSSENWTFFNLAKWNGREWTLHRVRYQGSIFHTKWILAFSETDFWINENVHWNGSNWEFVHVGYPIFAGVGTNKAWGTSSRDFYVVGDGGFIAHYNGTTWGRVESGTAANINDIWGAVEQPSGRKTILLAASNRYSAGEKKLLSIDATSQVDTLSWSPGSRLNTVWFLSSSKIYVGGSGLYVGTPGAWQQIFDLPSYYITRIRGTADNDVWVVGAFGMCAHYNGSTWKMYPQVALPNGSYEGLAVTSKLVIAVGYIGNRAVVLRGRR